LKAAAIGTSLRLITEMKGAVKRWCGEGHLNKTKLIVATPSHGSDSTKARQLYLNAEYKNI